MNWNIFNEVADAIERETVEGLRFDMRHWGTTADCGTAACLAGHVVALKDPEAWQVSLSINSNVDIACKALDILGTKNDPALNDEVYAMFIPFPDDQGVSIDDINDATHLVPDALRWIAANQDPHWGRALEAVRI